MTAGTRRPGSFCGGSDAAAATAWVGTGHQIHPRCRRFVEKASVGVQCRSDAVEVRFADAGIVVEVVAKEQVAVLHVVDAVQHVRVPDFVDVVRGCDFLRGELPAEHQKALVFRNGGLDSRANPVRVVARNELADPVAVDLWSCDQGLDVHHVSPRDTVM